MVGFWTKTVLAYFVVVSSDFVHKLVLCGFLGLTVLANVVKVVSILLAKQGSSQNRFFRRNFQKCVFENTKTLYK